ncbi:MAG: DUF2240 family protein [Asgard group archaeon]|nr:DUF2240 family protein [Asgard group archaeon]
MTLNMPYEEIVDKIVAESNLSKKEVIKKINDKVDELGGLITHDGAAHIIARDLEINLYESQQMQKPKPTKISDFMDGMNNVTVTALIKQKYEPTVFTRKDGNQGAVQNILLVDSSGSCRLVLWDDQIRQFSDMGIARGDLLRVIGVYVKERKFDGIKDISLSSRSQIDINPKDVDKKDFPKSLLAHKKIKDLAPDLVDIELIGKILAIRPPSTFTKKSDGSEGTVASMEVADDTGKIKVTLWDQKAEIVNQYKIDDVIEIIGGYTRKARNGIEVYLSKNASVTKQTKTKIEIPDEVLKSESLISATAKKSDEPSKDVRLADLSEGMSNISVIARITGKSDIRQFHRESDDTAGEVGSLFVMDNSGPSKITLWNSNAEYIKKVEIGDVIRIEGAYVKLGLRGEPEVHVGRSTIVEINPEFYLKDLLPELELAFTKLSDLQPDLRDVNVKAIVTLVQELRTFPRNDGTEGHVLNIGIRDNSGSVRLVAWNNKAIELESMEEMAPIEVLHGYTKEGMQGVEIHLGKLSSVRKLKKEDIGDLKNIKKEDSQPSTKRAEAVRVEIVNLEENQFSEIRGTIVKVNESKMYYLACPECRKKVVETEDGQWKCNNSEHGIVEPDQSIFISMILDDGTACIRVTFFREQAEQIIGMSSDNLVDQIKNTDIQSVAIKLQKHLEGREIVVKGRPKRSNYDQELEINAFSFIDADPKAEIELVKNTLNV